MTDQENNQNCKVGLFVTCLTDLFRPQVGFAAARLIRDCGCSVFVPKQSCCGQPAYNSGDYAKSAALAKNLIAQFEEFDYLVVPSGSCASMVKEHYPGLLDNDGNWGARARKLAEKSFELSEFLVDVTGLDASAEKTGALAELTVTYHDSCSGLRELGIRSQPRKLLNEHAGINITEMDNSEICCGFGGTFCIKFPEISTRLVDNKIAGIDISGADIVTGGDLGCLMNIAGRMKREGRTTRVFHFAELLLGGDPGAGLAEAPLEK